MRDAAVPRWRRWGRSRGLAFVTLASEEDAQKIMQQFRGADVGGRSLTVNEARAREERPARSFAGGGNSRGDSRNERNYRR